MPPWPIAAYEDESSDMVLRFPDRESLEDALLPTHHHDSWDALLPMAAEYMAADHHSLHLFVSTFPMWTTVSPPAEPGLGGTGFVLGAIPDERELHEALADLDRLHDEAKESDLPPPADEAVANARSLLPALFALHAVRYQVSPTERGGVSIAPPMKPGRAVSVECGPDDAVYCFAVIDGNGRRAKYYQMEGLPDGFVEKALRDLARE